MTNATPALGAVWPATSNSSPKSLATVAPGTARHWLVWQCRITIGTPAGHRHALGHEPFSRVGGEDLEHALVRVRRGERDFAKARALGESRRRRRVRTQSVFLNVLVVRARDGARRRVQHDLHFLAVPHQVVVPRGRPGTRTPLGAYFSNDQVLRAAGAGCVDADTAHESGTSARGSASSTSAAIAAPLATFASITTSPKRTERRSRRGGQGDLRAERDA